MASREEDAALLSRKIGGYESLGLTEQVEILGGDHEISVPAKIDTGADRTAIDRRIAMAIEAARTGERFTTRYPKGGSRTRELARIGVRIRGQVHFVDAVVDDRSNMSHQVLIGKDILTSGRFVIIPSEE